MKRLLALLLTACAAPAMQVPELLELAAPDPANLYTIELPAGDSGSINVGWFSNGAPKLDPQAWLSQGYDGVRFVGKGVDVTHLRCTSWDGITVAVKQHDGIVQLEDLTLWCGYNQATQFGEQNTAKKLSQRFGARLINCKVVAKQVPLADVRHVIESAPEPERARLTELTSRPSSVLQEAARPPPSEAQIVRPKWLVFGYQCDLYLKRVTFVGREAVEHDVYMHGFSRVGAIVEDCVFESAGAECFKVRPDKTETVAVPGTVIVIKRSKFFDWHQDWSWRGGAGIVLQGGASDVLIDGCLFIGGKYSSPLSNYNDRSHAVEIVAESNSWGNQYGNGHVWIKNSAFKGRSTVDWSNTIIRIARNSGTQYAARSVRIDGCGIYGPKVTVVVGQVPAGMARVAGCNTPEIRTKLSTTFDVSQEAMIPTASRMVPVSEGRVW